MPVFNGERYLAETLESILQQEFDDFELVISDNASTDSTWDICRDYDDRDPRIRLIRNETNVGAAGNYNVTVSRARGELFKWAAYDDLLASTMLKSCVAALDASGDDVLLAYPQTMLIDGEGAIIGPYEDGLDLRSDNAYRRVARFARHWSLCNAVMGVFRTDALRRTGLIRPYVSSDIVLLAEVATLGRVVEVPGRLFYRRLHDRSSRQGSVDSSEFAAWFDTRAARTRRPKTRLTRRVVTTVLATDLPLAHRVSAAAAFAGVWGFRKAHIMGSHAKRRLAARTSAMRDHAGTSEQAGRPQLEESR
jgi:glycosyltransferase involved in cell wall biosynthesis